MLSECVSLYFWIRYIFIVNIVDKHLYSVHFKSFRINAFEIFTKLDIILTKIEKKMQNLEMPITENCDVIEQNGLQIHVQQAKII